MRFDEILPYSIDIIAKLLAAIISFRLARYISRKYIQKFCKPGHSGRNVLLKIVLIAVLIGISALISKLLTLNAQEYSKLPEFYTYFIVLGIIICSGGVVTLSKNYQVKPEKGWFVKWADKNQGLGNFSLSLIGLLGIAISIGQVIIIYDQWQDQIKTDGPKLKLKSFAEDSTHNHSVFFYWIENYGKREALNMKTLWFITDNNISICSRAYNSDPLTPGDSIKINSGYWVHDSMFTGNGKFIFLYIRTTFTDYKYPHDTIVNEVVKHFNKGDYLNSGLRDIPPGDIDRLRDDLKKYLDTCTNGLNEERNSIK